MRGSATVTPRLTLGADAFYRSASSLDIGPTQRDENGDLLLLPFSLARTTALASTARYRISTTAEGTAEVSYMRNSFDSDEIVGGSVVVGRMGARRRYSTSATLGFLADASFTSTGDRSIDVGSLSGEWSAGTLPWQVRLRAGGSAMATSGFAGVTIAPVGDAELRRSARSGTYGVRYSRGAVQALGLGRALSSDDVALSYDRLWFTNVSVRASADHAWLEDPTRSGIKLTTSSVNAEARRPIAGGLWLAVGGFLRRRSQEAVIQNNGVFVNAGYTRQR
jgi:hypothetical protein